MKYCKKAKIFRSSVTLCFIKTFRFLKRKVFCFSSKTFHAHYFASYGLKIV